MISRIFSSSCKFTWFPFPVIERTWYSKFVKSLHWQLCSVNFTDLIFWRVFAIWPNCALHSTYAMLLCCNTVFTASGHEREFHTWYKYVASNFRTLNPCLLLINIFVQQFHHEIFEGSKAKKKSASNPQLPALASYSLRDRWPLMHMKFRANFCFRFSTVQHNGRSL